MAKRGELGSMRRGNREAKLPEVAFEHLRSSDIVSTTHTCEKAVYDRLAMSPALRFEAERWLVITAGMGDVFAKTEAVPVELLQGANVSPETLIDRVEQLVRVDPLEGLSFHQACRILRSLSLVGQSINDVFKPVRPLERRRIRAAALHDQEENLSAYGTIVALAEKVRTACEQRSEAVPPEALTWQLTGNAPPALLPVPDAFRAGFDHIRDLFKTNRLNKDILTPLQMSLRSTAVLSEELEGKKKTASIGSRAEFRTACETLQIWLEGTVVQVQEDAKLLASDLFGEPYEREQLLRSLGVIKRYDPEFFLEAIGIPVQLGQAEQPYTGNLLQRALRLEMDKGAIADQELTAALSYTDDLKPYEQRLLQASVQDAKGFFGSLLDTLQRHPKLIPLVTAMLMASPIGKPFFAFHGLQETTDCNRHITLFEAGKYKDLSAEQLHQLYVAHGADLRFCQLLLKNPHVSGDDIRGILTRHTKSWLDPEYERILLFHPQSPADVIMGLLEDGMHDKTLVAQFLEERQGNLNPAIIKHILQLIRKKRSRVLESVEVVVALDRLYRAEILEQDPKANQYIKRAVAQCGLGNVQILDSTPVYLHRAIAEKLLLSTIGMTVAEHWPKFVGVTPDDLLPMLHVSDENTARLVIGSFLKERSGTRPWGLSRDTVERVLTAHDNTVDIFFSHKDRIQDFEPNWFLELLFFRDDERLKMVERAVVDCPPHTLGQKVAELLLILERGRSILWAHQEKFQQLDRNRLIKLVEGKDEHFMNAKERVETLTHIVLSSRKNELTQESAKVIIGKIAHGHSLVYVQKDYFTGYDPNWLIRYVCIPPSERKDFIEILTKYTPPASLNKKSVERLRAYDCGNEILEHHDKFVPLDPNWLIDQAAQGGASQKSLSLFIERCAHASLTRQTALLFIRAKKPEIPIRLLGKFVADVGPSWILQEARMVASEVEKSGESGPADAQAFMQKTRDAFNIQLPDVKS